MTIERRNDPAAVERILRALPSWFGIEDALRNYVHAASQLPSYLALEADHVVGVALIKANTGACAELHLIAVDPSVRGTGVGTALVEAAEADLRAQGVKLFQVKTVGESFPDEGYAATRTFYLSRGFLPMEELDNIDWNGPTLILVKPLT